MADINQLCQSDMQIGLELRAHEVVRLEWDHPTENIHGGSVAVAYPTQRVMRQWHQ